MPGLKVVSYLEFHRKLPFYIQKVYQQFCVSKFRKLGCQGETNLFDNQNFTFNRTSTKHGRIKKPYPQPVQ